MQSKKYYIGGKEIKTYPPEEICAKCGGRCCKRMAGHYSPQDFEDLSFDGLKKEIEGGRISIDWWEGENFTREYYLRGRHVHEPIVFGSWGGRCVNHTENGCILDWEKRPLACKNLKPNKYGLCGGSNYSKEDCKNEWKTYSDVLVRLVNCFR